MRFLFHIFLIILRLAISKMLTLGDIMCLFIRMIFYPSFIIDRDIIE